MFKIRYLFTFKHVKVLYISTQKYEIYILRLYFINTLTLKPKVNTLNKKGGLYTVNNKDMSHGKEK